MVKGCPAWVILLHKQIMEMVEMLGKRLLLANCSIL